MKRAFLFAAATIASILLSSPAWTQTSGGAAGAGGSTSNAGAGAGQSVPVGNSAGPSQTGAAGANRTGASDPNTVANPNPNAVGNNAAGPNQTGAAGQQGVTGQAAPAGQATQGRARQTDLPRVGQSPFNGIPQTPWFNNPNARRQLQLDERGFTNLNQRYMTARERYNQDLAGLDAANLTLAQRQARMRELRRNFNNEFGRNVEATFTNRRARDRYNQLNRQFEGVSAFDDPAIQQRLNLNPTQQAQLQQLTQTWNTELQNIQQMSTQDRAAAAQRFNQLREQEARQISSFLTPDQQKIWNQQVGTPFNFEMNDYFPAANDNVNAAAPGVPNRTPVTAGYPPNENPQALPGAQPAQEQPAQDVRTPGTQSR